MFLHWTRDPERKVNSKKYINFLKTNFWPVYLTSCVCKDGCTIRRVEAVAPNDFFFFNVIFS